MNLLIPFVFFAVCNIGMVILSRQKFGSALPLTLMVSALLVYCSQMLFRTFQAGYWILYGLAVLSVIALIFRRKDPELSARIFTNGFYCYIILCIFVFVLDFHRFFSYWDELMHWGKMVKEMIRLDRFYTVPESTLIVHKEYPPFVPVFEMIFSRLQGKYSEMSVSMGLHYLELSMLCPWLAEKFDFMSRKWYEKIIAAVLLFVMPLLIILTFDAESAFNTICIDILIPAMFVYGISLIYDEKIRNDPFGYAALAVTMISLVLSKQICIFFAALTFFYYAVVMIGQRNTGQTGKKTALKTVLIFIPAVLSYFIWTHYAHSLGEYGMFDLKTADFRVLLSIPAGGGSDLQQSTFQRYVKALFSRDIISRPFSMTYFSTGALALVILTLIYFCAKGMFTEKSYCGFAGLFVLGYIGYTVPIGMLYLLFLSEGEMIWLSCYGRYMGSFVSSVFLILFMIFCIWISDTRNPKFIRRIMMLLLCFSVIFCDPEKFNNLIPKIFKGERFRDYRIQAEMIQQNTDEGASVFIAVRTDSLMNTYFLNYYLDNRKLESRMIIEDLGIHSAEDREIWDEAVRLIKENDYLYVYENTDSMDAVLGGFTPEGFLSDHSLYRIITEDGSLELRKI